MSENLPVSITVDYRHPLTLPRAFWRAVKIRNLEGILLEEAPVRGVLEIMGGLMKRQFTARTRLPGTQFSDIDPRRALADVEKLANTKGYLGFHWQNSDGESERLRLITRENIDGIIFRPAFGKRLPQASIFYKEGEDSFYIDIEGYNAEELEKAFEQQGLPLERQYEPEDNKGFCNWRPMRGLIC